MGIPYSRSDFGVTLRQAQGGDAATERSTERGSAERSPSKPHAEVLSKFSRTLTLTAEAYSLFPTPYSLLAYPKNLKATAL